MSPRCSNPNDNHIPMPRTSPPTPRNSARGSPPVPPPPPPPPPPHLPPALPPPILHPSAMRVLNLASRQQENTEGNERGKG